MPIRINLLAEQQAAEEARRRDPVKRASVAGVAVIAMVLFWSLNLQFKVARAKNDVGSYETQWKELESKFLQVSNDFRELGSARKKLEALDSYSTNRFLWSPSLNALQHNADDRVRLVSLSGAITYSDQKQVAVQTNIFATLPPRSWWWPFGSPTVQTNVPGAAQSLLRAITNRTDLARYQPQLISAWSVTTNAVQIVAKIEVTKPETVAEKVSLTLRARDYSTPSGSKVDRFYQTLTNTAYFKETLGRTNSTVQPESIQPRDDRTDLISPSDLFIPFTIQCQFPERIRSNE